MAGGDFDERLTTNPEEPRQPWGKIDGRAVVRCDPVSHSGYVGSGWAGVSIDLTTGP